MLQLAFVLDEQTRETSVIQVAVLDQGVERAVRDRRLDALVLQVAAHLADRPCAPIQVAEAKLDRLREPMVGGPDCMLWPLAYGPDHVRNGIVVSCQHPPDG